MRALSSYDHPAIIRNTARRVYHVAALRPYLLARDCGIWRARLALHRLRLFLFWILVLVLWAVSLPLTAMAWIIYDCILPASHRPLLRE